MLSEELLKKIQQFHFKTKRMANDMFAGQYVSAFKGQGMEFAEVRELFKNPLHPYTRALLHSVPHLGSRERLESIGGNVPNLVSPPSGCRFHPRCGKCIDICKKETPQFVDFGNEHFAACHVVGKGSHKS